jgi:hypothetical protein
MRVFGSRKHGVPMLGLEIAEFGKPSSSLRANRRRSFVRALVGLRESLSHPTCHPAAYFNSNRNSIV